METRHEDKKERHLTEIVLCQISSAGKAHRELFRLDESCYFDSKGDIVKSILSYADQNVLRLHVIGDWEMILKIAIWTPETPLLNDVLRLIEKTGMDQQELVPFKKADINDLFPWLYYGKRLDVLRKICNSAKKRAESQVSRKDLRVYCHLYSPDPSSIVASSL